MFSPERAFGKSDCCRHIDKFLAFVKGVPILAFNLHK